MNDQPWIDGFWTDRARAALPNLAWAIDEIPKNATLDELCVELESISDQSAYQTRTLLLLGLVDEKYVDPASRIQKMSLGSLRLGVWCMIEIGSERLPWWLGVWVIPGIGLSTLIDTLSPCSSSIRHQSSWL